MYFKYLNKTYSPLGHKGTKQEFSLSFSLWLGIWAAIFAYHAGKVKIKQIKFNRVVRFPNSAPRRIHSSRKIG